MLSRSTSKFLFLALVLSLLFSAGFAQESLKIGVVDSNQILQNSIEGKKVMAQLREKESNNQKKLAAKDEEIRDLQKKISTQSLTLTQEARLNLNSDLERLRTERQRIYEDNQRDMNETAARLFQKIQNEVMPIIEQVGKEKGLEAIFDRQNSGVVYFSPSVDITQDVIQRYDDQKAKQ
ncbi:MAG TPA: OmpH family outer membrane protein [Candidatus Aminicenantes bacterium]|nr:OmpH family outer membrane protein [Candidatus Aminicenantes bacterium]